MYGECVALQARRGDHHRVQGHHAMGPQPAATRGGKGGSQRGGRCGGMLRYARGPHPHDFDGQRALDFVLDNSTLQDFNRTLLIDIKLLNIRG